MSKILIIIPSLSVGGTITSLSALYSAIKDSHDVSVFAMAHDSNLDFRSFSGVVLARDMMIHAYTCNYKSTKMSFRDKIIVFLIKLLKRLTLLINTNIEDTIYKRFASKYSNLYDVVIGYQEGSSTRLASYFRANKKIAWIHCDYRRHVEKARDDNYYKKFDNIICVSEYTASIFKDLHPRLGHKLKRIYNLLDYNSITRLSCDTISDKRFKTDKFTILSVGRLCDVKRFEEIPLIAMNLIAKGLTFRWYIIGPASEDQSFDSLLAGIEKYRLSDVVVYLGNKHNPYPYFKNSDLLVSLSLSEACPMIFNEAKVLNLPILTTDFTSAYEFINNGHNGIISKLEKIGDNLSRIISDMEFYEKLKTNMSAHVYSDKDVLHDLHTLLAK